MPVMNKLISALKEISKQAMQLDFYKAGKAKKTCFTCWVRWLFYMRAGNIAPYRIHRSPDDMTAMHGAIWGIWKAVSTGGLA
jgi:hypothetical protein